ncbi:MAG: hypothetical protein IJQ23_03250 [Clostridia bacterium]|nr:hypothetical protein [Clostridia bacterium]
MKKALSCKIIFLCIACALCFALAFSFLTVKTARAADVTQDNITNYFGGAESFDLDGTNLVANVKKDGQHAVSITNALIVDDLAIELNVPDTVSEFKVALTYDSYFVNGAENADTHEFDKEIKNEFTFTETGDLTVEITTENNVLSVKVGADNQSKDGIYYKIKGADKCAAIIAFDFTLTDDAESADITFKSINQKYNDGVGEEYKQTFALDGENKIATLATSRVSIDDLPILKGDVDTLKVIYGKQYKFSFTTYSVFGDISASNVYVKSDNEDVMTDPYNTEPKSVIFNNTDDADFKLCYKDGETEKELETYNVLTATERDADNDAPKYIPYDDDIYGQYAELVKQAAKKEYTIDDDTTEEHSIRLGDSYEIPSLQNLVTDNLYVYSDLTYTVYYRTPSNASGSTSSLKFTVSEAGKYEFFVVFKDPSGNAMEKDDFYKVNPDDENAIIDGIYKYAVFTFDIKDDAPISVEVPATQGAGYVNTKYVASGFEILSGSNVTYTLYYNEATDAKANSDGWVEVNTESDYFTEAEIESIAYDGKYTFTPIKVGSYKIKCEVSSGTSSAARFAEGETVISVREEPAVVKPDNHWFKNNVWSLVFLSVGTLSLIGIIVLLFIKPKEEVETDETGDALNISDKK